MMYFKRTILLLFVYVNCILTAAAKDKAVVITNVANGIVIRFDKPMPNGTKLLKLEVVTDNIVRVIASPVDSFSTKKSLITVYDNNTVKWNLKETDNQIMLSTNAIIATVAKSNGAVSFTDKDGKTVLAEQFDNPKVFIPTIAAGEQLYQLTQTFQSPDDEALYGLGQHQQGEMNYKGKQVVLQQNNTEVAIPFLVSNKNYGILWDNYSITKVGDVREFLPLSSLRLFSKNNEEGWLSATYTNKSALPKEIFKAESSIDYEFIDKMKSFPDGFKLEDGTTIVWEGAIESGFTGIHSLSLKYAGYIKIWVDGKLLGDWWRQSWNPRTADIPLDLVKNKKYAFKIEWKPNGGESYIACKWLPPAVGSSKNEYAFLSEAGRQIDYYFVYGKTADEVIGGYRTLTGKAVMVPKWAMGFWQSRERYKTQDEITTTMAEFRKRQIPIDNIVEDWSYWKQNDWGSHDFDTTRFPDAAAMIKNLHDKYHAHFMISVWPKYYELTDNYKYLDANGWLYKRNIANKQGDWIGTGYTSTFYDAYNPDARKAVWGLMNKKLYSKGVDAWWLDASEPDIYSNVSYEQRKQLAGPTALGSSTEYYNGFPLQNAKAVYEGQRSVDNNKRVFILTRSAFAGSQRYAATVWSGDIASRWEDLKVQIPAGINFCMSGMPYWTTDIGGFATENRYSKPNNADLEEWREQMTRWYQYGAFCPLFRVHGQFPYREIFNTAPETHPAYKSMLYYNKLRYRLMPYIYSLTGKTYHDNYTIMRGLPMDFANDEKIKNMGDEFMFGPSFLIAPITTYHQLNRNVYLPAGQGWYEMYSGKYYDGGQNLNADAPYERIPVFVKEGSIVPTGPAIQYTDEKPADSITLFVYTGKNAQFNLYEDEGTNYNYEQGRFANISFDYNETLKTLTIDKRQGIFNGMLQKRLFKIVFINKQHAIGFDDLNKTAIVIKYSGEKISLKDKQDVK